MARRARLAKRAKKTNVYRAQKVELSLFETLKEVLIFVGKPVYILLSHLIIAVLFLLYILGYLTRTALTYRLPAVKLPKVKLKLFYLKGQLLVEMATSLLSKIKLPRIPRKKAFPYLGFIVVILFFGFIFWYGILRGLPSPKQLTEREIEVSTKIYDRNGVLLYKIYKDKNRTVIPLSKIPLHARLATLAAEDAEFYSHPGISIRGIMRAATKNIQKGELSGGSTITQQLVKNALLSPEKTLTRKMREVVLSVEVELTFTKDQILEMYFNEVPYGGTAYGVEAASQQYFGKDVKDLTLAEAALLAGLPKSPTKFSPFGANPDLARAREVEVLRLMRINKFITKEQEGQALKEKLVFAPNKIDIKAPHFVMYVRGQLVDKYGEEMVEKGGLEVVTTLDYEIQKLAEETVASEVEKLKNLHVGSGAALVLNPKTGEILAMVGSKDYFDTANDGNVNVTIRARQPGSSIKVVNYSYALANGFTPASILDDSPVTFVVPGQPPYSPRNYDGAFRGRLSLRSALAQSRNIPAVKVLASYGVGKMIEQGRKMGITTWEDTKRFGLSLTLGGGEVKLIDLAKVYATIADYGKRPEIASILEIKNYKGEDLEKNECLAQGRCEKEQAVDPGVAYLLIDILKDNVARAPEFGLNSALVIPKHPEVAVKTGTSNDLKDNLTVGFNQKYLVATWVGNNDATPMARVASGVTGASPIWSRIMTALLASEPSHDWEVPQGLVQVPICSLTGTLPCEGCATKMEWFRQENKPKSACSLEQIQKLKGTPIPQILEPAARTF